MPLSEPFAELYPDISGDEAFHLYEHARHRLPGAVFPPQSKPAASLLEIAGYFDIFVFDAYGVLNAGPTPIPGAADCVAGLRALGKQVRVLTNAASFPGTANVAKFSRLGFDFTDQEIISSRMAAEQAMAQYPPGTMWGVAAAPSFSADDFDAEVCRLGDDPSVYEAVAGFALTSSMDWGPERQAMLESALAANPRPVIVANPDIVAPLGDRFSTEPGYSGHRLAQNLSIDVQFHGKPFPSVYRIAETTMALKSGEKIPPARIAMIGDTLHTDVLGGAARGWGTVLVTDHGLFKGLDSQSYIRRCGIVPHWTVGLI